MMQQEILSNVDLVRSGHTCLVKHQYSLHSYQLLERRKSVNCDLSTYHAFCVAQEVLGDDCIPRSGILYASPYTCRLSKVARDGFLGDAD